MKKKVLVTLIILFTMLNLFYIPCVASDEPVISFNSRKEEITLVIKDMDSEQILNIHECWFVITIGINHTGGTAGAKIEDTHCLLARYPSIFIPSSFPGYEFDSSDTSIHGTTIFYVKYVITEADYTVEHYKQKADGSGYEKEAGMTGSGNATVGTGVYGHMNTKGVI